MVTRSSTSVIRSRTHDSLREGVRLGLVVATSTWAWLAVVDAVAGEPFRTGAVLGGTALFAAMHYLLNLAYGVAIVSAIHGAAREPSLIIAVLFAFVMVEIGFAMATVLLSHLGLGALAWVRILGGSLIGAAVATVILARGMVAGPGAITIVERLTRFSGGRTR